MTEYELKLEQLFEREPALSGVCQYHSGTLPTQVIQWGLRTHRSIFINESVSEINPYYAPVQLFTQRGNTDGIPDLRSLFARPNPFEARQ